MESALYMIPNTLGDTEISKVIPSYNIEIIKGIRHFIVESRKQAVRFLIHVDKNFDIDSCTFSELSEHTDLKEISHYLDPLKKGEPMGVISDAGCPGVADPGADIVQIAQANDLKVVPLVGPSSILMAVMGSGFSGQSFAFNGYLPAKPQERANKLKSLESRVYKESQTQLFIETPYRNAKMFETCIHSLRPDTKLCIAAGITCKEEFIKTKTIAQWKKTGLPDLGKIPAIWLIYK